MNREWVGLDEFRHRVLVQSFYKPKAAHRVLAWLFPERTAHENYVPVFVEPINVRLHMFAAHVGSLDSIMKAHREQHSF